MLRAQMLRPGQRVLQLPLLRLRLLLCLLLRLLRLLELLQRVLQLPHLLLEHLRLLQRVLRPRGAPGRGAWRGGGRRVGA